MKNFKKVLSLALAALMVIGGLVIAPVDAQAADTTYSRVYDGRDIKAGGDVILVAKSGEKYYAVGTSLNDKSKIAVVEVTVTDGKIVGSDLPVWTITSTSTDVAKYESARVTISNGTNYLGWKKSTNFEITDSASAEEWIVTENNDTFCFTNVPAGNRALALQTSSSVFGPYSTTNSNGYIWDLMVFKSGTVTPEASDVDPELTAEITTEAQVVEALKALKEANGTGNVKDPGTGNETFQLTGIVQSIDTAYNADNGTITVTIACSADETILVQCYNLKKGTVEDISKIAVGDLIKAEGTLHLYNGSYSFNYGPTLESYTAKADIPAPTPTPDSGNSGNGTTGGDTTTGGNTTTNPNTGDMNTVGLYIVLFAGVALVAVSVLGKKKMA